MWNETPINILKAVGAVLFTCVAAAPLLVVCLFGGN